LKLKKVCKLHRPFLEEKQDAARQQTGKQNNQPLMIAALQPTVIDFG
jgi:hypothetical protein